MSMSEQLAFPIEPLIGDTTTTHATIQERFEEFDRLNPWVYNALEILAADMVERGRTRVGMKMLVEVVRWQYDTTTTGDVFRLNNSYASRYVRKLIDAHPDWADVFETRELKAA